VYRLNAGSIDAGSLERANFQGVLFGMHLDELRVAVQLSTRPILIIEQQRRNRMADDRERNQGMKQGTGEGTGQHAPGRNPQGDRAAGGKQGDQDRVRKDEFDPSKSGDGGSYKEGGQNEHMKR
jgi:hypothetical protein